MALPALPAWAAVKLFMKSKKFLIPLAVVLLLAAIGGGTYAYINHSKNEAVAAAVAGADSKATIQTYETKDTINNRNVEVDRKFDELRDQTTKDYSNARNRIQQAPAEDRTAQAPRIIIDTLNDLDRLRASREPAGVPDADLPVG